MKRDKRGENRDQSGLKEDGGNGMDMLHVASEPRNQELFYFARHANWPVKFDIFRGKTNYCGLVRFSPVFNGFYQCVRGKSYTGMTLLQLW